MATTNNYLISISEADKSTMDSTSKYLLSVDSKLKTHLTKRSADIIKTGVSLTNGIAYSIPHAFGLYANCIVIQENNSKDITSSVAIVRTTTSYSFTITGATRIVSICIKGNN